MPRSRLFQWTKVVKHVTSDARIHKLCILVYILGERARKDVVRVFFVTGHRSDPTAMIAFAAILHRKNCVLLKNAFDFFIQ